MIGLSEKCCAPAIKKLSFYTARQNRRVDVVEGLWLIQVF